MQALLVSTWRRQRESMLSTIASKEIVILVKMNGQDLGNLSREAALETVLRSIKCKAFCKEREADNAQPIDEWDVDLLDRESSEVWE
jgi:hypothetical protein